MKLFYTSFKGKYIYLDIIVHTEDEARKFASNWWEKEWGLGEEVPEIFVTEGRPLKKGIIGVDIR